MSFAPNRDSFQPPKLNGSRGTGTPIFTPIIPAEACSITYRASPPLCVNTAAALPYGFAFSISMASSSVRVRMIEITGPNVFAGYNRLPDETAAVFTDDGWFRSGDLGFIDEDGYLHIAGRVKDLIISGGENIYPAEVENLISDLAGVTGVAGVLATGSTGFVPVRPVIIPRMAIDF